MSLNKMVVFFMVLVVGYMLGVKFPSVAMRLGVA